MSGQRCSRVVRALVVATVVLVCARVVRADEIWVAATSQQDLSGLEIGNSIWPVTPIGGVRLVWAVPNNLQAFQSAKVSLIPGSPAGAATLNVDVCAAVNGNPVLGTCAGPFALAFTGVANQLIEVEIGSVIASKIGTPGANYLAVFAYTTPTTNTDHIVGMRFSYTPTPPTGVPTLSANTFTGTQTAPQFSGSFVGNGSGLTNLPTPSNVATLGANTFSGSQTAPAFVGNGSGLTNLPFPAGAASLTANTFTGTQVAPLFAGSFAGNGSALTGLPIPAGVATVGANTFNGTQTIAAGNLDLGTSTSASGNLTQNGTPFLHSFGNQNTFLGSNAGNFTMVGDHVTAVGAGALASNTSGVYNTAIGALALNANTNGSANTASGYLALSSNTASFNTGLGYHALQSNTTAGGNTAVGAGTLQSNTTGFDNTAIGGSALPLNTSGSQNVVVGGQGLFQNSTGNFNVALGYDAGLNGTTGSNNIYLGANVQGAAGESNTLYLGQVGTQTKTFIAGVRGITTVNNDAMPVVIDSAGQLGTAGGSLVTLGANTFTGTQTAPAFVGDGSGLTNLPVPSSVATLGANTYTGTQEAPQFSGSFAGNGSGLTNVPFPSGAATLGANTFSGAQTATAFFGSGAGLTNLPFPTGAATLGANTFGGTQTIGTGNLDLNASTATSGNLTKNGTLFLHNFGDSNTFLGLNAGNLSTSGAQNTGIGKGALGSSASGGSNTAVGYLALSSNTDGTRNTAIGDIALLGNTSGTSNTANGYFSLANNTGGSGNTAIGIYSLGSNVTGGDNTALGMAALQGTTGSGNLALGSGAGGNATTGSNNIYVGANVGGIAGESNTMYLGLQGTQTKTIIAGVRDITTVNNDAMPVVIDSAGQLGTAASAFGSVISVASGAGLTGGPITTSGTLSIANGGVTNSMLTNATVTVSAGAGLGGGGLVPLGGSVALSNTGVLSVTATSPLTSTGGPNPVIGLSGVPAGSPNYIQNGSAAQSASFNITGNATVGGNLDIPSSTSTAGNLTKNGSAFLHDFGSFNVFLGNSSGNFTLTGNANVGVGYQTLGVATSATMDVAVGSRALKNEMDGGANTAVGYDALLFNTTGIDNTAIGADALANNIGSSTTGGGNTAVGVNALENSTGEQNVAVGGNAGQNLTSGSRNIYLGSNALGASNESNTMYLGVVGTQTKTLIAGVRGITTLNANAIPVMIDSSGQLGTISSSRRFKEDIHDMADASQRLFNLRPVTFRYTKPYANGEQPIQFGLVAEEVAAVFPELAVRDANGAVETVHYETLSVLLLNEVQKQQQALEVERALRQDQQQRIEALEQRLNDLERERRQASGKEH